MLKQAILIALLALALTQDVCPSSLLAQCEKDAQQAYTACDKAAKEKGKDEAADINCVKFFLSSKKECWPCICVIAKKENWKVKGCQLAIKLLESIKQMNLKAEGIN